MVENDQLTTSASSYQEWQSQLCYDKKEHGKICYFCHIPQCNDALHDKFQPSAGSCEHPNVLSGVANGIFHHPQW
jgi:hypothetical protein